MSSTKRDMVVHKIRVDEYTAVELAIPRELNAAEFAGLMQRAKRLFNVGGRSFDDPPEDEEPSPAKQEFRKTIAEAKETGKNGSIGIWTTEALKLLHGPCKDMSASDAAKYISKQLKSERFKSAAIYNRRYYERNNGIQVGPDGIEKRKVNA